MEARCRHELEQVRQEHSRFIDTEDDRHKVKRKNLEEEKSIIVTDKNSAVEEAKKKLAQLNKIDLENREL